MKHQMTWHEILAMVGVGLLASLQPAAARQLTASQFTANPNEDVLDPNTKVLATVTIKGTFVQWADPDNYKSWTVAVSRVRHDPDLNKLKQFPISANGSFKITLENIRMGSGYYLHSKAGDQRFSILSNTLYISTVSPS
jgi:hypothetical protein